MNRRHLSCSHIDPNDVTFNYSYSIPQMLLILESQNSTVFSLTSCKLFLQNVFTVNGTANANIENNILTINISVGTELPERTDEVMAP